MDATIRRARISDNDGVLRLLGQIAEFHHKGRPDFFKSGLKKYTPDEFKEILLDEKRPVFVAVDGQDNVLGYVFCMIVNYKGHAVFNDYDSLYIDDFCVDENVRGKNIGKQLFEAVKDYARGIGVYLIDLNVWEFNEGAIKFYEKCGFRTQRRRMEIIL